MRSLFWRNKTSAPQIYSWVADEDCTIVGINAREILAVVSFDPDPISRYDSGLTDVDEFILIADGQFNVATNQMHCPSILDFPINKNQLIYVGVSAQGGHVQLMLTSRLS